MKASTIATICLVAFGFTGCITNGDDAATPTTRSSRSMGPDSRMTSMDATSGTAASSEAETAKNERRIKLERSVDNWWYHFKSQEYSTADGIATVLERYVNANYDGVVSDVATASPRFRKVAAAALGFSGQAKAVTPLTHALDDPFQEVTLASLLSLYRLGLEGVDVPSEKVAPFLSHADKDIRSNAALVLSQSARTGDGSLFLPLTNAMEDSEDSVRVHAAAALGALGDADALPFLVTGLSDPKPLVRIRAAYALGRIGDRRALSPLAERLDDPHEDVSRAAYKALKVITGQDFERRRDAWTTYVRQTEEASNS